MSIRTCSKAGLRVGLRAFLDSTAGCRIRSLLADETILATLETGPIISDHTCNSEKYNISTR
ncbi:MAG: hypothetical protein CMJ39_06130 [Phycisphaerae bacterium]|nr:hypothetical protein [Phycisphaerae bacterium]